MIKGSSPSKEGAMAEKEKEKEDRTNHNYSPEPDNYRLYPKGSDDLMADLPPAPED
jgi:hypothetical protein